MSRISNGNLIVLKWQIIHMISNIKEREREREQNLAKQFALYPVETYSEPFPTSKQAGYLIEGNYFHKNIHLICLKWFWIKTIKPHKANTNHMTTLKPATQSLENLWNISYNGIIWTGSNNLPTKLALPYHPRSSLINNLIFNLFITVSIWCTSLQACWNSHKLSLLQFYQTWTVFCFNNIL